MTTYSYQGLMDVSFDEINGKHFVRLDTGEIVGELYARYPKECGKLSALVGCGLIEFINRGGNQEKITKIYGIKIHQDVVTFKTTTLQM